MLSNKSQNRKKLEQTYISLTCNVGTEVFVLWAIAMDQMRLQMSGTYHTKDKIYISTLK